MKHAVIALAVMTSAAQAAPYCGVEATNDILFDLRGGWIAVGGIALKTADVSAVEPFDFEVRITPPSVMTMIIGGQSRPQIALTPQDDPLNAEQLDTYLTTSGAHWIMDEIAKTDCDVSDLLQFGAEFDSNNGDSNIVHVVPYSKNRFVVVLEVETRVETVPTRVTVAGLLER